MKKKPIGCGKFNSRSLSLPTKNSVRKRLEWWEIDQQKIVANLYTLHGTKPVFFILVKQNIAWKFLETDQVFPPFILNSVKRKPF